MYVEAGRSWETRDNDGLLIDKSLDTGLNVSARSTDNFIGLCEVPIKDELVGKPPVGFKDGLIPLFYQHSEK